MPFGMVVLGLLLGLIGTDVNSGTQRFTFGIFELADGIGFVTVAMGMFGLGEIIRNLQDEEERSVLVTKITGLWPTKEDFKRMVAPILRGTVIGSALGILPGSGSILGVVRRLLDRKEGLEESRPDLAKAQSKASPLPNRRTMPARKPRLFHC